MPVARSILFIAGAFSLLRVLGPQGLAQSTVTTDLAGCAALLLGNSDLQISHPGLDPAAVLLADQLPSWWVMGHQPPWTASAQQVATASNISRKGCLR